MNVKLLGQKMVGKAKKNAPGILIFVGIAGTISATVMACKKSKEAADVFNDLEEKKENVKELCEKSEELSEGRELAKVYAGCAVSLAKVYYKPLILGAGSIGCILYSHKILSKRLVAATAAYGTLDSMFRKYRGRVIEELGEEADKRFRLGTKEEKVSVVKVLDDGSEKVKEEKVTTMDGTDDVSDYGRWFSYGTTAEFEKNSPEYNLAFLKGKESYFNQMLQGKGFVFLNDVYDELGFDKTPQGQVVGWLKDGLGDGFVDFGIVDNMYRQNNEYGINPDGKINYTNDGYFLDFNVDGVIWDKI